jgi:hypothetical protein
MLPVATSSLGGMMATTRSKKNSATQPIFHWQVRETQDTFN